MDKQEKDIIELTEQISKLCGGKNSATVVGACMNMIQTCMSYGSSEFQRATAEMLRGMAGIMLNVIGKQKH